ncbi:MAG: secretin N-terminal domain-containing protein, partial [Planctomycetota bacterium]|jgi:type II secretion system protein D
MERRYADVPEDIRQSQRPLVLTDLRSSSLLVAANPEDLEAIRDLTGRLEATPINPAVGLHVISLEAGRAEQLAPMVEQLMRERESTLGEAATPVDKVTIESDTASNSLIVAASNENLAVIESLIAAIDEAGPGAGAAGTFEVIPVTNGRASDVLEMLEDLYVEDENRRRGDDTVRVSADERLNGLIVNAPASDIAAIRRLVAQLDGARPSSVVEIKYIALKSANALETVGLIDNVLSGRGIGMRGRGSERATVIKYLRQLAGEEPVEGADDLEVEVSAAIRESIVLTPDVRTNTIIVSAPRDSMTMIERMIADLDSSSTGAQSIRIFKLVNADALDMRQILTELFSLERQGNLYVLKPREGAVDSEPPVGAIARIDENMSLGSELTAVPDERQQLSITVDQRTNSLLVSGTPTYLDLVANVVEELDAQDANERNIFVYPLRNADAGEVATAIRTFVDAEQDTLIRTLGDNQIGSAARLLEREVTIVDDSKTNSVLVSVSPRYEDRIRDIIQELDVDPPQVLIQVLLAEVTLDTSFDWGVDLAFTAGNVTGGFELASTPGLGNLPALGGGVASAAVAGQGVPSISVSAGDFQLLIKALSVQGRLQVLSNPAVMAANNEPARIQVGETIRVPDATSFDLGSQQTSVIAEDVGIILSVTPFINPDGFVRMAVQPEISELSKRTTQISEDFQAPIIQRRNADTTVTVRDGQTIVIGGLISDRYERRDTKVPLFGDLPLIGPLFRNESVSPVKTELLIVLTPHVIESPGQIDLLTESEVDRLSLPSELKDQIRRSMLEGRLFDSKGEQIGGKELEGIR